MMHFSKTLKTATLAGLFGLGMVMASPALAHRVYTRCDNDGDRCYRVICDDDGDDCRRTSTYYNQSYNNGYYNNGYYGHDYDRDRGYYNSGYRRWVCDSDGDRCHWSYNRW